MTINEIAKGVVHQVPADLKAAITSTPEVQSAWEDITPMARNEWICWVTSTKKPETRQRRIGIAQAQLASGKRRPCCWQGCSHR